MELIKINENYSINDENENWLTTGNVSKEVNGNFSINIFTTLKTEYTEGDNRWGSLHYNINAEGNASANYHFIGSYKEDYVDYAEGIIADILERLS